MADSFFGFNTSDPGPLDEGPECMDEEEEQYDALNDETFGNDGLVDEDWEEDHEKFAEITEHGRTRPDVPSAQNGDLEHKFEDSSFEARFSNLAESVLDDSDESYYRTPQTSTPQSKAFSTKRTTHTYSTSAPSGFSLWGPQKGDPLLDPAVLQASPQNTRFVTNRLSVLQSLPSESSTGSVQTVEELERKLISKNPHRELERELIKQSVRPRLVDDLERELTRPQLSAQELLLRNAKNNIVGGGLAANLLHPAARLSIGRGVPPNFPPPVVVAGQVHTSGGPPPLQFKPGNVPPLRPSGFGDFGSSHLFLPPQLSHLQQSQRLISAGNVLRFIPPHLQHQQQQHFDSGKPHHSSGGGFYDNFRGHERYHNNVSNGNTSGYRHDSRGPHGGQNGTNYAQYNGNNYYGRREGLGGVRPLRRDSEFGGGEFDEYDGLMTLREQHWLANIQQMQLSTDKPLVDDYYFTVYTIRKQRDKRYDPNSPKDLSLLLERSERERENGLRMEHRIYTPMQFENSLGKLQVGSVTAPRKIIDLDLLASENVDTSVSSRETKKYKQLLLELEWLYSQLLLLEEIDKPLLDPSKDQPTVQRSEVVQKINSALSQEEKLTSFLCIRKGKTFFRRLLPLLGSQQPVLLWFALLHNFSLVSRRDQSDQLLLILCPWLCSAIAMSSFSDVTKLGLCLIPSAALRSASPLGPPKNNLSVALGNKLGVSAIVALIDRAEVLYSEDIVEEDKEQWSTFITSLVDAVGSVSEIATPTLPSSSLVKHLNRFSIRIEKYSALEKAFRGLNLKSDSLKDTL